jgi:hypothetical protein
MDASCLQHRLSEEERQAFNEQGWPNIEKHLIGYGN